MSTRNVIKRDHVVASEGPARPAGAPRPSAGTRLVELEPGRYAIEHVCRCGEVSILELEVAPSEPAKENHA